MWGNNDAVVNAAASQLAGVCLCGINTLSTHLIFTTLHCKKFVYEVKAITLKYLWKILCHKLPQSEATISTENEI